MCKYRILVEIIIRTLRQLCNPYKTSSRQYVSAIRTPQTLLLTSVHLSAALEVRRKIAKHVKIRVISGLSCGARSSFFWNVRQCGWAVQTCFILEDGTDSFFRNVGDLLSVYAA